ncbi:nitroimidazol reductase NimA-like FMN-containing flavoprotein (pyridoxamine 5'-phosphate oxidase superfamily) [Kribbella orskensis]|uniref:Nitroimidazol reductase NimA-like FMN-containing flavoprotein (Pyridoxamine 5'-phosphate oxidase superfamily) n=1 Tax=Kribbella orskensis TaxID=2512216 RepID=A0ABY2BHG1_9ACTN|nr:MULTISPECIES: pyridoxamine 5'-phosphate oxidase family protein [Kribbella]TCN38264.1 nitroimidazol reductase NimA-like FMN-containing flavoprotein (pyridoxamine 5'-phosphate oxidase superfamily) [Kribbella sp. VKM Ac-2500]TCO20206.1 nitroimidazol reductase NimA-like FMN-containing flavoprotein (pyridoxamine 5'-phosphate oxidase superfamily) [Kribbella orskensis]
MPDRVETARQLITDNLYMALGTADESGTPWVSPVFFTPHEFTDFYWVSSPDTQHSRNIAGRPEVSIAIFDTHAVVGTAEAVYCKATAQQVPDEELEAAAAIYNSKLPDTRAFPPSELVAPAIFRLYRATVHEHSVLVRGGDPELGKGHDSRLVITLP